MPSHCAVPRYSIEPVRLKKVWPPEMPVSRPRSTISMPRVTMKPLSPNRMISRALTMPMARPTARVTGTAQVPGSRPSPCPAPFGTVSHAATPGARPIVDSSDRSIFFTISTRVSASTSTAISDIVCKTLIRLSERRNTGLTTWPTIAIAMMAGISARSRNRAMAIRRPGCAAAVCAPRASLVIAASDAVSDAVSDTQIHSFHRGDQGVVVPSACHLGHDAALEHHQNPVAAAQVVQFVRGVQHSGALRRRLLDLAEQELLGPHVHPGGRADQYEYFRVVGQGPGHDHLLLVAAGQAGDLLLGSGGHDGQVVDHGVRDLVAPPVVDQAAWSEPPRHAECAVVRDRHLWHVALVVAVLRHEPDPGGQRVRHAAGPWTPPGDADLS